MSELNTTGLNQRADELIEQLRQARRPRIFVISGPSGVGKDSVIQEMRQILPDLHYAGTATTRPHRPGEIDGVHYYFLSHEEFTVQIELGEFMEHATVYGNLYGVPKQRIRESLRSGRDVVIKVDVQGARTIRAQVPSAVLIFVAPPSMSDLLQRLRGRKSDDFDVVIKRLNTATHELACAPEFDFVVFNESGQLSETVETISTVIEAEHLRINQPAINL